MPVSRSSLSWFILVFTLLEFVVRTHLTAYDNSHGFISSNNHERYLANDLSSMQEDLANDLSSSAKYNIKLQLKFEPEFLDFKQRPIGVPHLEKVTLFNTDKNRSVDMTSISGNTVHFHSSFFEDKKIPPLGNTSFNVVFLGREEGSVESNLFIHTTEGELKYRVKAASTYSPYRLRPIVGVKLPLNATFSPIIYLYNPHLEPIQIVEIYSSGGDFHLELPTGEMEEPKDIWEIPPLHTKAVIRLRFNARAEQNHTAYVRIKLNNIDDILVVPLEVEVTSQAMLFAPQGLVDFGVGGSLDPIKEVDLMLNNPTKKDVHIHTITCNSEAIQVEWNDIGAVNGSVEVAKLKLNWKAAYETSDFSGRITVSYKNNHLKTEIPYYLTVVEGGLNFNVSSTKYYVNDKLEKIATRSIRVRNDFLSNILLINVTLQDEGLKFFEVSDFVPHVLKTGDERTIFTLNLKHGVVPTEMQFNTFIVLNTNVSSFEFPLVSYDGKLEVKFPFKSKDNSLDLGLIGVESKKECNIILVNNNPVTVILKKPLTSLSSNSIEIVGCGRSSSGDYRTAFYDEAKSNLTKCTHIRPGEFGVLKLSIKTGHVETQIWGDIAISTQFEQLSIPVHFKVAHGKLEIGPDRLVFDECFPGKVCSHPIRVHSTFSETMNIEEISSVPPDVRISSKHSGIIYGKWTKVIGHLYLHPNKQCGDECYLGLRNENKVNWMKTLFLPDQFEEFDLNLVNTLYARFLNETQLVGVKWQNLTIRIDTSEVRGHTFKTRVKMSWPTLLTNRTNLFEFPLTQVGNTTYRNITIRNPSSHNLVVQIVMDCFYPKYEKLVEGLPPAFFPSDSRTSTSQHSFYLVDKIPESITLKPSQNFTFKIGFKAIDSNPHRGFVFLRNNLTVLELIQLNGKGAVPNFKFGNRKPGSEQPLLFELIEKHLKDCETTVITKKYTPPALTVKRTFTARNMGDIPVHISGFHVNSLPCEGYGFKILNCEPVTLPPNGTKKIDIAFSPDFTLTKISRTLVLQTSLNFPVNYTLVTTVPRQFLTPCGKLLHRPYFENIVSYFCAISLIVLLVGSSFLPFVEVKQVSLAIECVPRQNETTHTLNLKLIGNQIKNEIPSHAKEKKEDVVSNRKQPEEKLNEKYTAVVPTVGSKTKKSKLRNNNNITESTESRKKNWVETHNVVQNAPVSNKKTAKKQSTVVVSNNHKIVKTVVPESPKQEDEEVTSSPIATGHKVPETLKIVDAELNSGEHKIAVQKRKTTPVSSSNKKRDASASVAKQKTKKETTAKPTITTPPVVTEKSVTKTDFTQVQTAKPTMYVEPFKQTNQKELGPIGSRKHSNSSNSDLLNENVQQRLQQPQQQQQQQQMQQSRSLFSSPDELVPAPITPAAMVMDIFAQQTQDGVDTWSNNVRNSGDGQTSSILSYIQGREGNNGVASSASVQPIVRQNVPPTTVQDPWPNRPQCSPTITNTVWDSSNSFYSPPIIESSVGNMYNNHAQHQQQMDQLRQHTLTNTNSSASTSNYLWSSPVWEPWSPPRMAEPPTRTPPGFSAPLRDEDMLRQPLLTPAFHNILHQTQQNQFHQPQHQQPQAPLTYHPFGPSSIWEQQRNPWNYPQE